MAEEGLMKFRVAGDGNRSMDLPHHLPDDDSGDLFINNSVFPITVKLLSSMAITAITGVNRPLMAMGMARIL